MLFRHVRAWLTVCCFPQNEEQERTRHLQSHVQTHSKQVEELENSVRYLKAQVRLVDHCLCCLSFAVF